MESTNVVLFEKESLERVLNDFDFRLAPRKIDGETKTVVISSDGNEVLCCTCSKLLTMNHVGTIAHGSRLIFCDNPVCFSSWVAKNKIK